MIAIGEDGVACALGSLGRLTNAADSLVDVAGGALRERWRLRQRLDGNHDRLAREEPPCALERSPEGDRLRGDKDRGVAGNLLVADFFNKVFKISPDGLQTTVLATVSELSYFIAVEPGGTNNPAPVTILSPHLSGNNFAFSFNTVSNQSYTVQQNINLATTNWTFYTNFTGNGAVFQLSVPLSADPQRFFRVVEP